MKIHCRKYFYKTAEKQSHRSIQVAKTFPKYNPKGPNDWDCM